jgi:8-oxo-dGTP pyrophosphatase MutT (NUDIX family)
MNLLLTIDERDINPNAVPGDRDNYKHRVAARAVVFDADGQVALLHASTHKFYKLPGGGVDEGEDIAMALERELMEEVGCNAEVLGEVGIAEEYRDYWQMIQTSHCFTVRVVGEKGEPDFTDEELADGFEVVWCDNIGDALELLKNQKPNIDNVGLKFMIRRDIALLEAATAVNS